MAEPSGGALSRPCPSAVPGALGREPPQAALVSPVTRFPSNAACLGRLHAHWVGWSPSPSLGGPGPLLRPWKCVPGAVPPWSPCLHPGGQSVPGLGPVSAVSVPDILGVQRPSECAKRDLRSGLRNRKRGRLEQAPGRQMGRYAGEETGEEDGLQGRAGMPPGPRPGPASPAERARSIPPSSSKFLASQTCPYPPSSSPSFLRFPPGLRRDSAPIPVCAALCHHCVSLTSLSVCVSLSIRYPQGQASS